MALWKDENGNFHDDMDGAALSLPIWPQGLVPATKKDIAAQQALLQSQTVPDQATTQTKQSS